jgi:hypothetical protein
MAKWSHSVLAGFDRAMQGIRTNAVADLARPRGARPRPTPTLAHAYEVSPAIGFAAIGSHEGCRFEVLRRSLATGVEERVDLDHRDIAALTWTIKVANSKSGRGRARALDPGIQTLSGRGLRVELARPDRAPLREHEGIRSLGLATTDAAGNLIVFAAEGRSVRDAETNEWFDDDCDGWVRAELQLRSGPRILAARVATAWFVATFEFTIPPGRMDPDEIAPGDLTQKAIRP